MCGFIALFSSHDSWDKNILQKGVSSMASRGPDGSGEWWSKNQRVGLAHRRLAIIDLDDRSDQPMISTSGRYVIVFNGEIYNYKNLRIILSLWGE
jgi:asparagine synthase (glutamine-hydrolysing)